MSMSPLIRQPLTLWEHPALMVMSHASTMPMPIPVTMSGAWDFGWIPFLIFPAQVFHAWSPMTIQLAS